MGGDQLQTGVEDGGTPTEVVAAENKKILKRKKQENPHTKKEIGEHLGNGYPNTTPHSQKPLAEMEGNQLQQDGRKPTEVVA